MAMPAGLHRVFRAMGRALAQRDYRLFFAGQAISQVGTWMQQMTVIWLSYRLTGNAFLVGAVGFCAQFPTFILSPVAGVWADRMNRRRLLLVTQALAMIQAFALAGLTLLDAIDIWSLILLVALLGAINAFDMTASQAFVKDLVHEREVLGSAIALNSAIVNAARLVGPALAGMMIYFLNEGGCFLVNGFSFLAVLLALSLMRPAAPATGRRRHLPIGQSLREGIAYSLNHRPVRDLLILVAVIALFGMPYTLLPVYAREVLDGGSSELGLLMGAGGLGALFATLRVAARPSVVGSETNLIWGGLMLAVSMSCMALADFLGLALLFRLISGYCVLLQLTSANTLVQTLVDDDQRGRVMSFYTMAVLGALPLGNLLAGGLAGTIGVAETFVLEGICCLGGAFWFWLRLPAFRRDTHAIYDRLGLARDAPPTMADEAPMAIHPH